MKLAIALVIALLKATGFSAEAAGKWDYQYTTKNAGTRSEYVVGTLSFEGERLAQAWRHVITPIGEFIFVDKLAWADASPNWVPVTSDGRGSHPHFDSTNVKNLLSGVNPNFRKCVVGQPVEVSNDAYMSGKFEERAKQIGSDWFYAVDLGWWVNPKKIGEALQAIGKE